MAVASSSIATRSSARAWTPCASVPGSEIEPAPTSCCSRWASYRPVREGLVDGSRGRARSARQRARPTRAVRHERARRVCRGRLPPRPVARRVGPVGRTRGRALRSTLSAGTSRLQSRNATSDPTKDRRRSLDGFRRPADTLVAPSAGVSHSRTPQPRLDRGRSAGGAARTANARARPPARRYTAGSIGNGGLRLRSARGEQSARSQPHQKQRAAKVRRLRARLRGAAASGFAPSTRRLLEGNRRGA